MLTIINHLASTGVLLQTHGPSFFALCRFSCLRLYGCSSRSYRDRPMSTYPTPKVLLQKKYPEEEQWEYLEKGALQRSRSTFVCITCQYFDFSCDKYCRTLIVCRLHQCLIPHADHLTSRCFFWQKLAESGIGACQEVA